MIKTTPFCTSCIVFVFISRSGQRLQETAFSKTTKTLELVAISASLSARPTPTQVICKRKTTVIFHTFIYIPRTLSGECVQRAFSYANAYSTVMHARRYEQEQKTDIRHYHYTFDDFFLIFHMYVHFCKVESYR